MPTGRLGAVDVTTGSTYTLLYTCPSNTFAVTNVNICNRTANAVQVRLALTTSTPPGTPGNGEFLEFDTVITGNGVLERTGIVLDSTNRFLSILTPTANALSVVVYGIETSTV